MQQQPPLNDVNALLKQEYRKPINHLLQTSNILLGTVRLLVATARLTLVFSLLVLLAVHTVSPNTFSPLWTAMINDQRVAPITSIAPVPSLAGTDEEQDASLRASEREPQEYRDALAAFEVAIAPHTPPADDAAVMAHTHQALKPANAAPEAAPETVLYAQPISQPDYATRALNSSTRALHTLLTIASLLALLACVLTNEGRFTWVYEDKAYTLYRYTQSLLDQYDMAKLATEHALEKARHADQREGGI
ncbi:TPA: hypothetical protein RUY97_002906 [Aeromonas dhakensis]|nr:hypothetical protein [Aeromonas dhakensis]HDX8486340.1 hypothetical protein [Aeromonas dhakensis]HDX8512970.1 hypothetical protein [Aeromonas dhakensis]HDZ8905620.1 hypothetical protein [Aeromonas dhakensis]HDZ9333095.1 hypothetical protein [Aeromonas dhakensis]